MSIIQVLVDAAVPSEDGIVIKWVFKPGSVERSIDVYQRGSTIATGDIFNFRYQYKLSNFSSGYKNS
jgi:hypothetical protein